MNITQENIDKLNAVVKIQLKAEDYKPQVEKAIKDQAKKVKLPGFRPGMVPAAHIKKMYGKSILVDEVNRLLSDSLNNYITENKIEVLGQPLPKVDQDAKYNWDFEEDYDFSFELGLAPEVKATFSAKDKVPYFDIQLDAETLASRLKNIRRSYGKMTNPDTVAEGDVIYGELVQLSPDGSIFEGGITNTASLRLDLVEDKATLKSLIGLKKDDVLELDVQKAYKKDAHRIAQLLNIDEELAKDLKSNFRLTVKNINRIEEAELNQEFFDKVYGAGAVNSEEEFMEKMKGELKGMMTENADRKLQFDIVNYGVEKFSMDLPDAFLKRWLKTVNEDKITDEQIAEQYDDFAKNLRWTLIENKIVTDNNLEIKSEEVVEMAKKRIDAQFRMYSPTALTEEQLQEYAVNFLQDRERASKLYEEVRSAKVFDFLKSVVTLDKKEIDYNKFLEMK